ncbi:hypothetical protein Tco_0730793 [Tanacetum coccineum]
MGGDQEIFRSKAWRRTFDINEPIYAWLCHDFYSTYEFNEVVQDDDLWSSKLIKFRLAGRDHLLTLLQFAKRLGLYFNEEVGEEGFEIYFRGGLCSDEHFNAREYWLSISREDDLHLSRSHASTNRKPIMRVLQKMILYGLLDEKERSWESEREHDLLWSFHQAYGMKDDLSVLNVLSALTYCRALDRITLRELIGSNGRLITEAPMPGAPRIAMPVPLRPSMQDLYDRMGNIEIRQGVVERKAYRQSYQYDMYAGVFEHMARVYDIPPQGAYNPPGYDQEQYQQYY